MAMPDEHSILQARSDPEADGMLAGLPQLVHLPGMESCCAICLEEDFASGPFQAAAMRLPCGHLFHCACISRWLEASSSCPYRCSEPACFPTSGFEVLVGQGDADIAIPCVPTKDKHDARAFLASSRRRSAAAAACRRFCVGSDDRSALLQVQKLGSWWSWWRREASELAEHA
eukprot:TRINITY_DN59144_c0_g1_i1.p2 TRINITY_DN59144_c0_g1~~TRINITY_DN59144_c0_g1_i1.p2  ORF type:complete len:173 (+),score=33.79 TRINITY_DN59144_c0_g1_i1:14-532(+)